MNQIQYFWMRVLYASCVVVADIANIAKAMNDAKTSWMVQNAINT
jgi:hypothetical protein